MILTVNSRPVSSVTDRATWVDQASCAGVDQDLFFPGRLEGFRYDGARKLCAVCPVITDCLKFAMNAEAGTSIHARAGMFGGTTPVDRMAMDMASRVAA